ncbi:MAG: PEP-CTERM-box response regulator transcription factor [Syntrophobacteraceae bacterium]|nr:PEP-CTERM-box response regulator transcription factor [Syntrophobacteraceae bacterium]
MDKPGLLIVDDDESNLISMKWAFAEEYEVFLAGARPDALEVFKRERPPLVTLDLGLPPDARGVEEGFLTLAGLIEEDPDVKVVIISGRSERQNALRAVSQGAYDFFCKPVQVEEVSVILRRALRLRLLEMEHRELQAARAKDCLDDLIGTSPQMQRVFETIEKVAGTEAPILIGGESGTGKELAAKALHGRSRRKGGPFVAINCAAIPENLLESELFGHEKGAFTGAHAQRKGRIELAHKGTLFLDEIGDLPGSLQVKILRFLQEHKIERVGGRKEITIDTRVIAATNVDLDKAILEGRFREDLYYRLGVVKIQIPPLRDRDGDIEVLAVSFLQKYAGEQKKKVFGFTQKGLTALKEYKWPGNVRELENRMRRAVIMAQGRKISEEDLELDAVPKGGVTTLKEARENTEREIVLRTLKQNNFNVAKSASELEISRPSLYELMEKLGIRKEGKESRPSE